MVGRVLIYGLYISNEFCHDGIVVFFLSQQLRVLLDYKYEVGCGEKAFRMRGEWVCVFFKCIFSDN